MLSAKFVHLYLYRLEKLDKLIIRFEDWQQCTAVMQREAVTVMQSCSGGGNVVVA
jgi:hypothetical protein